MMIDVLLVNPYFQLDIDTPIIDTSTVPNGILSIGTMLDFAGYKVEIQDMRTLPIRTWSLAQRLLKEKIKQTNICVGLSVMTAQVENALQISDYIKMLRPELPVAWGGWHPTLFPEQTCADPSIDYIIQGEGEYAFLELIKSIETSTPFQDILGLGYKRGNRIKLNPEARPIDLNALPFPAWRLLNISKYIKKQTPFSEKPLKGLEVISSRGCPHRCAFCINTVCRRLRCFRAQVPGRTVNEVEFLVDKYKIEYVHFHDDNFFTNRKRVEKICDLLKGREIDIFWYATMRADYFCGDFSKRLLAKARSSGFRLTSIGAESGSDRILKLLKKDITVEQILTSAKKCDELDIIPIYSFMIGVPYEKREDMLATLFLAKKLKEICPRARFVGIDIYRPYPGSELYELCKMMGFKEPRNLREWSNFGRDERTATTGYHSINSLPWIQDPEFVIGTSLYALHALNDLKDLFVHRYLSEAIFTAVSKIRTKFYFYKLPGVEKTAYLRMLRILGRRMSVERP